MFPQLGNGIINAMEVKIAYAFKLFPHLVAHQIGEQLPLIVLGLII
jgi:hypothetical protein